MSPFLNVSLPVTVPEHVLHCLSELQEVCHKAKDATLPSGEQMSKAATSDGREENGP